MMDCIKGRLQIKEDEEENGNIFIFRAHFEIIVLLSLYALEADKY